MFFCIIKKAINYRKIYSRTLVFLLLGLFGRCLVCSEEDPGAA